LVLVATNKISFKVVYIKSMIIKMVPKYSK
jgi:hypothetical protein